MLLADQPLYRSLVQRLDSFGAQSAQPAKQMLERWVQGEIVLRRGPPYTHQALVRLVQQEIEVDADGLFGAQTAQRLGHETLSYRQFEAWVSRAEPLSGTYRRFSPELVPSSAWQLDLSAWHAARRGAGPVVDKASDLLTQRIVYRLPSLTHLDVPLAESTVFAYDNADGPVQPDYLNGDFGLKPGEFVLLLCHHIPEHRQVDVDELGLEDIKNQVTHARFLVGVNFPGGHSAVVPCESPLSYIHYASGVRRDEPNSISPKDYPHLILSLALPTLSSGEKLAESVQAAYADNLRTWMALLLRHARFPRDYNGSDPLANKTIADTLQFGDLALSAIAGDTQAKQQMQAIQNQLYCMEYIHTVINLGIHYPISAQFLSGRDVPASEVIAKIHSHQRYVVSYGRDGTSLFEGLANSDYVQWVAVQLAPDWLKALPKTIDLPSSAALSETPFGSGHWSRPWTMVHMVDVFLRRYAPHTAFADDDKGRALLASARLRLLRALRPTLAHTLGVEAQMPQEITALLEALEAYVAQFRGNQEAFRAGLEPFLHQAEALAPVRADGRGAFVPPHLPLYRALGLDRQTQEEGLLHTRLLGLGLHRSLLKHQ